MNLAICGDCGIDLEAIGLALGIEDVDTLDLELGVIDFILGNFGETDKDARISALIWERSGYTIFNYKKLATRRCIMDGLFTYTRHTTRTTMAMTTMRYTHQKRLQCPRHLRFLVGLCVGLTFSISRPFTCSVLSSMLRCIKPLPWLKNHNLRVSVVLILQQ